MGDDDGVLPRTVATDENQPVAHLKLAEAMTRLPTADGKRFVLLFERGATSVELYAPRGHDPQTPHAQDELYIVAQGRGELVTGGRRIPFATGDALFVAKGEKHRFENFTDDFSCWVIFY
jgi:mannose-6-phosphate isomerase-like protein (cupin superfamily)